MLHDLLLFLFNTSPCFLALARYKLYRRLSLARGWICLLSYSSRPVLRSVQVRKNQEDTAPNVIKSYIWKSCGIGIIWKSCGILYETHVVKSARNTLVLKKILTKIPFKQHIPCCRGLSILSFRVIACLQFVQKLNQTSQEKLWALNRSA